MLPTSSLHMKVLARVNL